MTMIIEATGPKVGALQRRLNSCGATRLPRLKDDEVYGSLTMARVMEFQFHSKFVLKDIDGKVGPATQAKIDSTPSSSPSPSGQVIVVDLIHDRLRAFRSGTLEHDFRPIKGGSASDPTTRGVFKVFKAFRHHTSSKFPVPPGNMDFALFFHGAEALHQGPPTIPSHGCIHVEPSQAAILFRWAGGTETTNGGPVNDVMVIVLKRTP
jgi:hypothetical protein